MNSMPSGENGWKKRKAGETKKKQGKSSKRGGKGKERKWKKPHCKINIGKQQMSFAERRAFFCCRL